MTDAFSAGNFAPATDSQDLTSVEALPAKLLEGLEAPDAVLAQNDPQDVTPAVENGFVKLGLAPELLQAVDELGFTKPTPVQEQAVPLAMPSEDAKGFIDLMVSSQTGSGKTAAFLLPVLHTLLAMDAERAAAEKAAYDALAAEAIARGEPAPKRAKRKDPTNPRNFTAPSPGALVLCPTRELAQQVAHDAIDLVRFARGLRVANVVGGMPYREQIAALQNARLVVATPGRLLDLQRSGQIKLEEVRFLVVDEADRMLDLGFSDDLAEVNQLTSQRQQTMMFSATFAPRIQQLAGRVMREPRRVQIDSPQEKHANIEQIMFWADNPQHKRKLLDHWLRTPGINQAIVFASTQIECDELAGDLIEAGFSACALHGALNQGLRNRRLMSLRQGRVQFLVATDVAARGIDVPTITHVFNFGLPMKAEDYTHRIGRTGRAGRDGLAVTFAEFRDRRKIVDIERYSQQQLKVQTVPGMEPTTRMPRPSGPASFGRSRRDVGSFGGGGKPFHGERRSFESRDRRPSEGRGFGNPAFAERAPFDRNAGFTKAYAKAPAQDTRDFRDNRDSRDSRDTRDSFPRSDERFAPRPDAHRRFDKPFEKSFARPFERSERTERTDHTHRGEGSAPAKTFAKPFSKPFEKSYAASPDAARPHGAKPAGEKPFGAKPFGAKPFGAKPFAKKAGGDRAPKRSNASR